MFTKDASDFSFCCPSLQLSPAIVGGLHNIARSIESRSYTEGLNIHTHIISNSNFSETSAFMPVLKVVLTQANKLGVWSSWNVPNSSESLTGGRRRATGQGSRGAAFDSQCKWWEILRCMKIPLSSSMCHLCFLTQLKQKPCYQAHSVVKVNLEPSANKCTQQIKRLESV